jgi:hypothetical protein
MTQLYALTGQYLALQELADSGEMELSDLADTFEAIEGEYQDKAVAVIQVAQNYESTVTAIDAEVARLNALKTQAKKRQTDLREYLRTNMEASGISKIEHPLFKITLAAGRDVVEVTDPESIPDEYMKVTVTEAPDKVNILKALKDGASIPGVAMMKSKTSLRIK